MNKTGLNKITALLMVVCMLAGMPMMLGMPTEAYAADAPWEGFGTEEDPYKIFTSEELISLSDAVYAQYLGACFQQMDDISLAGTWAPIGSDENTPFTGTYDGSGFTISDLTIADNTLSYLGLFGYVGSGGRLKNIQLEDVDIGAYKEFAYAGGLVGVNGGGTISNSSSSGSVTGGSGTGAGGLVGWNHGGSISDSRSSTSTSTSTRGSTGTGNEARAGGLVGWNDGTVSNSSSSGDVGGSNGLTSVGGLVGWNDGTISHSDSSASVTGGFSIGGLVGINFGGDISHSHSSGNVTGVGTLSVSGLVGASMGGSISHSYNSGSVTGEGAAYVAGLIGMNEGGSLSNSYSSGNIRGDGFIGGAVSYNNGSVSDSYNSGSVSGENGATIGGLVALDDGGTVSNSYYDSETAGQSGAPGIPKSTAEMKRQATFENWNFSDTWRIGEDISYPMLQWQDWTADERIGADRYALSWDSIKGTNSAANNVTTDLSLPATGAKGSDIHWSVSPDDGCINTGNGAVTRPGYNEGDKNVTLTATINYPGGTSQTKTFDLTLIKALTYTMTYVANGGTGPVPTEGDKPAGVSFNAAPNSFAPPSGKQFKEWNTAADGSGTGYADGSPVIMPADNLILYAIWEDIPIITYTVTYIGNGNTGGTVPVDSGAYPHGSTVTVLGNTGSLTKQGHTFAGWSHNGTNYTANSTFTITSNVELYALWTSTGSSSGSSRENSTPAPAPAPAPGPAALVLPNIKAEITKGRAVEPVLEIDVNTASNSAVVDLGILAGDIFNGDEETIATVPSVEGVNAYVLELPASVLSDSQGEGSLTFSTDIGSLTIGDNMLATVAGIEDKKAAITIGEGDKTLLPDEVKAALGDRPIIQLILEVDGAPFDWSNENAPVTVSIPYQPTPQELEDPEHIVVWYIDGSGNVISIPSGRYNPETGTVTFSTSHFSRYAVAYVHKTFGDLDGVEWARKPIEVMASKGIISGTSAAAYSPGVGITRADYLVLLTKTLGLTGGFDGNFDDVKPGAYYYQAVGIARKLGIASGSADNRFNPTESISRQDMTALTARALEKCGGLQMANDTAALDKFSDQGDIAEYAAKSLATLVEEGLIVGSADKLNPRSQTTRAEAAVFLYRIYNRY